MTKFGETLRLKRTDSGKTMVELSQLTGISQSHISQLENGKRLPNEEIIHHLAEGIASKGNKKLYDELSKAFFEAYYIDCLNDSLDEVEMILKNFSDVEHHNNCKFYVNNVTNFTKTDIKKNILELSMKNILEKRKNKYISLENMLNSKNKELTLAGEPLSDEEKDVLRIVSLGLIEKRKNK
ncbi:helix-turn-helix domain-containing protein [Enterococcus hirae]|uniref:helix-turn-helix domain-containing protein n=1 Tax=Enterococcus hirae TaxID=1354 RepID=UPI003CE57707